MSQDYIYIYIDKLNKEIASTDEDSVYIIKNSIFKRK